MRIAIDISQVIYPGSGVSTYTKDFIRALLRKDRDNLYILFGMTFKQKQLLLDFYQEFAGQDNVRFIHIPVPEMLLNRLWNGFHIINVEKFIGNIDLLHSSDWIQPPTKAVKVTTVHDLIVYFYPQTSDPYIVQTQKNRMRWVIRECDAVIADSEATKTDLIKNTQVKKDLISVLYPGISEEFKPVSRSEISRVKQKYGLLDEYIIAVGTREPRKNLKNVFSAFQQFTKHPLLQSKSVPVGLAIVGREGWGAKLPEMKHTYTLGYVDQKDLPCLYSGAQFLIFPSLYEGFGFPVLEAMACGCPVITSDRGSLREVVGQHAVVVDPDNPKEIAAKMVQLYVDYDLRKELRNGGLNHIKNFSWTIFAEKLLKLYQDLYKRKNEE